MITGFLGLLGNILPPPGVAAYEFSGGGGLGKFLSNVIVLIAVIAGIVAFYNILIAGFQFITSAGNPKGIEEAWKKMLFSLIGLLVIIGAFILTNIISAALGFNFLTLPFKGP